MVLPEDRRKIAVIGGDERQIHCARFLADIGYEIVMFGFDKSECEFVSCNHTSTLEEALYSTSIIVLPINVSCDDVSIFSPMCDDVILLDSLISNIQKDSIVLGGRISENLKLIFENNGARYFNYFEREELVVANARLTAESAVSIAMNEKKESMTEKSVLVIGYGRIGKMLCHILKGMGVNVYASARKKHDFEWIRAFGYLPVNTKDVRDVVERCSVIFNTVPNLVLSEKELHCLTDNCLVIDLASKPGGIDFEAAKKLGIHVIWALSLPGKNLPVSAGRAVAKTIINILEDEL